MINQNDYRIFGFDPSGQLRVNLYHGADLPSCAGSLYSWTWARTSAHLAHKLETQWEQPLSGAEWETIEELELFVRPFHIVNAFVPPEPGSELLLPFSSYVEQVCDDCGGSGHDVGSLHPTNSSRAHTATDPAKKRCSGSTSARRLPSQPGSPAGPSNEST